MFAFFIDSILKEMELNGDFIKYTLNSLISYKDCICSF